MEKRCLPNPLSFCLKKREGYVNSGAFWCRKNKFIYILCKCMGYCALSNDWTGISYKQNKIVVDKGHDYISFSAQGLEQLKHNNISIPDHVRLVQNEIKTSYYSASELHIQEGQLPVLLSVILFVNLRETGELSIIPVSHESALKILLKELIWVLAWMRNISN